jgi:hypothetical protein
MTVARLVLVSVRLPHTCLPDAMPVWLNPLLPGRPPPRRATAVRVSRRGGLIVRLSVRRVLRGPRLTTT